MKNYVITVARGFGSGGKEISSKLSEVLGIPFYDKEILEMASEMSGIHKSSFEEVDEKFRKSNLVKIFHAYRGKKDYVAQPEGKDFRSDDNLFQLQSQVIRRLAETESCIVIGKCADYVLKDYDNVIRVYIEAPRRACLKSVMKKLNVDEWKAAKMIEKTDKFRADYYRYYTGNNWTNPINYDFTLNSDKIGRDKCVKLIQAYVDIRFGE